MSHRLFRSLSLVTIAAVAVAFTQPARAEDAAKDAKPKHTKDKRHWTGTLESIDATAGTCTVMKGKNKKEDSKTFKCAADCKVIGADDKPATLADAKAGDKVTITYTDDGTTLLCHSMEIKPPKGKAEKAEKAEKNEKAK